MQYRELGKTGIKVSALGFGAMRLPLQNKEQGYPQAVELLQHAFSRGVNYLDTAYLYGESELACAQALKGWRDKVYLATKNPKNKVSGKEWNDLLTEQLQRLQVEYIDFYLMHNLQWAEFTNETSVPGGPLDMAKQAVRDGRIRRLCFSCHDTTDNMIKIMDSGEFSSITLQYNLLDRSTEKVIAHAHEIGVGVVVMGPIAGGRLAPPSPQIASMIPGGAKSTPEAALRFVLANPGVSTLISGMENFQNVDQNVEICSRTEILSEQEKAQIEAAMLQTKKLADLYCTGCQYCMPCPNEVNIPYNFSLMNLHKVYGLTPFSKLEYAAWQENKRPWIAGKPASSCIECGQCEPKCPQKIEIMRQLKDVHAELATQ